jgi:hypothetical protein
MRYEQPAIEERLEVRALLGAPQISGGAADLAVQPIWRSTERREDSTED